MRLKKPRIDPVCSTTLPSDQVNLKVEHKGTSYYFCAAACRDLFRSNPSKYVKIEAAKPKGFWQRYLARLKKSTGGKPPSCCG